MSDLIKYKFDELYTMSSGISSKPEQAGHGAPFASFSTVFNNFFLPETLPDLMDTSKEEQEIYSIKKGDILLTRTSETIDELGMSCVALKDYPKATFSGFTKRLRPTQTDITYDKFMGFYLRSPYFRKLITSNAFLTLRASLNEAIFSYLNLYLPDYQTQKNIGDFLYLLNSKIELNQNINTELSLMIKTIYDYWFVQFDFPNNNNNPYKSSGGKLFWNEEIKRTIPEGWEVKELSQISSSIMRGISPSYTEEGGICVINQKCIRDNSINFEPSRRHNNNLKDASSRFIQIGDVLVNSTGYGTLGRMAIVKRLPDNSTTVDSHITVVRCDGKEIKKLFLGFSMLSRQSEIESLAEGSTGQTELSRANLGHLKIIIPPIQLQTDFENLVKTQIQIIAINEAENESLIKLRDWLLPMLMNGQITIDEKCSQENLPETLNGLVSSVFTD